VPGPVETIDAVIARLEAIGASLPATDGVGYFNRLYLAVTQAIQEKASHQTFEDEAFVRRLDVVFANLYLAAYDSWEAGASCPPAWRPLFDSREHAWRLPIQFALAGMNAHICHDLPLAVVTTCEEQGIVPDDDSPQHRDYTQVNRTLAEVEERVKGWFLTGILADLDRDAGKVDDALAMWKISEARACAWHHARTLWELRPHPRLFKAYAETLARLVDFGGRGILV
jgi:hypothetical protein